MNEKEEIAGKQYEEVLKESIILSHSSGTYVICMLSPQ
jgi:hypothetical protein